MNTKIVLVVTLLLQQTELIMVTLNLPENKGGLIYRTMGIMENHVWSIIAKRMKHNHTSWSIKGGNNLAKILAKKCSGRLNEVASKLKMPVFEQVVADRIEKDM